MDTAVDRLFNIGDRVRIINNKSQYKGELGTVAKIGCGYIGVYVDKSKDSYYRSFKRNYNKYAPRSLEKIGDNSMAKLDDFNLVARVRHVSGYDTNKIYCFALYDPNVAAGDYVVVNTFENPQICKVESVVSKDDGLKECPQICKPILGKVDASAFLANEEKKKVKAELRKKMDAKKKQIEALKTDEYYASLDPEYKEMLEKMKELS